MIKIRVPATTANMGPGFDCIGMALKLYNYLSIEACDEELIIETEGKSRNIPLGESNLIYRTIQRFCTETGASLKTGIKMRQNDFIPMTRGLGSSAACVVSGLLAANELTNAGLSIDELVELAAKIEGHPDNSTPAFVGGVTVGAMTSQKLDYIRIMPPIFNSLSFVVFIPSFPLLTEKARQVLLKEYPIKDVVFNTSRAALLVAALLTGDVNKLMTAMDDRIHQPYRMEIIPNMQQIMEKSKSLGAKAVFLSGAGPTIIAVVAKKNALPFRFTMKKFFSDWEIIFLEPDYEGAKIERE